MGQDYNKTINLPKTDFPMRAALAKREPGMLEDFERRDIYRRLMAKNEGKPKFILHDGPPYANGNIHIGTAMNKVLKDFIVRYKNMSGFQAPYVPGWDTHGMPIETAIQKQGVKRSEMPGARVPGQVPHLRPGAAGQAAGGLQAAGGHGRRGIIPMSP